jgi:hypothetical protein
MLKCIWGLLAGAMFGLVGCVPTSNFKGPAYMHEQHAYMVSYDKATNQQVMGDEWILDNYRRGETTPGSSPNTLSRKDAPEYMTLYSFDLDDDGKYEDKEKLPAYDLLFKHRKTNAQIWVSTIPLSRETAEKELRVLLDNYVDAMSGSGAVVFKLGTGIAVDEKRFSARLVEKTPVKMSGKEALAATIEVANVDQLKLSPDARREKARIVLVRPDFRILRERMGQKPVPFRVLMVVGYSNGPEDFDAQYPEFERFLGKIHLLTDEQVMELAAADLEACANNPHQSSTLEMLVRPHGSLKINRQATSNLEQMCASEAFAALHFPLMDEERTVKHVYDWSKPPKLKWLTEATYEEPDAPAAASDEAASGAASNSEEAAESTEDAAEKKTATPDLD